VQEAVAVQAERSLAEKLKPMGWTGGDLTARRKDDPEKVALTLWASEITARIFSWKTKTGNAFCTCWGSPSADRMAEEKEILGRRLRQETTMSLKWIAQPLQMGSWTCVFNPLQNSH
jgi:hypothetical protein